MQERHSPGAGATDQALILVNPGTLALLQASRRVHEELGYSDAQLRGMSLADIVLHPPPEQLRSLALPAADGGAVETVLGVSLREIGGRAIPAELLLIRIADAAGAPLAAIVRFGDGPRLAPGDTAFVDFASRLGHDLNNLLSTVIGSLGLIHEGGLEDAGDEDRQFVEDALSASRECADLVSRLMATAGKQFLRPQRVSANTILRRLKLLMMQTLPDNIVLQLSLDPELPDLEVDPDRLETAIIDLIVNAREAMPSGGELVISSSVGEASGARPVLDSDRRHVQITVSDAGVGIPDEIRDRVLEPLFTTKPGGAGRGLGLSVVNGFVQQSHGALSLDSKPGRGTRITLSFPTAD